MILCHAVSCRVLSDYQLLSSFPFGVLMQLNNCQDFPVMMNSGNTFVVVVLHFWLERESSENKAEAGRQFNGTTPKIKS